MISVPRLLLLVPFLCAFQMAVAQRDSPARNATHVQAGHPKTLSFLGPEVAESDEVNPFTDYRLLVTFRNAENTFTVRGFYAADGNAAESGAESGNVWQARFSTSEPGIWRYSASLRRGEDIAIDPDPMAGEAVPEFGTMTGEFEVRPPPAEDGLFGRGVLGVANEYLQFENGDYFLKGGADSPENLLAYADFDGTYRISTEVTDGEAKPSESLHRYEPHEQDWKTGDPTWRGGKGKGLIGAVNYLASTGMNAIYFLTMNIGGDGKDVWPYASPDDPTRFDCSKLDQWEIVFRHMQRRGILLHVVTQETENELMLDGGDTGRLRTLYYQELIARFAHHPALVWNLGEENGPADFSPEGQNGEQQRAMATYLKSADPYRHPVIIHTHATPKWKDDILPDLLGHKPLDGLAFQVHRPDEVHREVIKWKRLAADAGHPWLITMDEIGPWQDGAVTDAEDSDRDVLRAEVLWGGLLAGAAGVEWYFGAKHPHNDLTSEDWRQRESMWRQTKVALDCFQQLPYWEMEPHDELIESPGGYCFAKPGHAYAIYLKADQSAVVSLPEKGADYRLTWLNPKTGGRLEEASQQQTAGPQTFQPPEEFSGKDTVLLLRKD